MSSWRASAHGNLQRMAACLPEARKLDDRAVRILLLTHYFSTHGGGVELVAAQVATLLARDRNADINWAAADVDTAPTGLPVRCSPLPSWNPLELRLGLPYPLLKPKAILTLWRAVQACDVVHIHECQYMHSLLGAAFSRLHTKPYIVTQHVGDVQYRSYGKRVALRLLNSLGVRLVLNGADSILFVSAHVSSYFRSRMKRANNALVVPNGVDLDRFHPSDSTARSTARAFFRIESAKRVVAFVGRFVEKKGLTVIQSLATARPDISFVLAGRGPIDPNRWCLGNVLVAGMLHADQLAMLYRAADVLCLPSFGEGFPLVVQEAIACGCPVMVDHRVADGGHLPRDLGFVLDVLSPDAQEQALMLLDRCFDETPEESQRRRSLNAAFARHQWSWNRCADSHWTALTAALQ
jgi:glycosyltransferase involved in cell wall biosynthesis